MSAVIDKAGELVSGHAESDVDNDGERFRLTPLGLIEIEADDRLTARRICDRIELYLRRNGQGMAIVNNRLAFVEMEPVGEVQL